MIEKYFSSVDPTVLLHLVIRPNKSNDTRCDVIDEDQHLQLAILNLKKGKTFRPHKHLINVYEQFSKIAQESWIVLKGRVKCTFYDTDDIIVAEPILEQGDISVTLYGGHTYTILEDSLVSEYKIGPWGGQKTDKIFIA